MQIEMAKRIDQIPPYLFAEIDKKKEEMRKKGIDLIDLGIGDADLPTPVPIIERLKKAAENPKNHRYPSYEGMIEFRTAAAHWYERRFGIKLNPETEVLSLIGSKEGIAHIPLAFVNPGDVVLVPSPGYPVYRVSTLFAGGTPYFLPLRKENGFLPKLSEIPETIANRAKLLVINYPNNPTSAIAERSFFEEVVAFAQRYQIIVCHDAAYSVEVAFDGYQPLSFLEVGGAKEVGIEFHSLSKTFNMTGWRIGFAVGHSEILSGLGWVKTNIDSGLFQAIQEAGTEALRHRVMLKAIVLLFICDALLMTLRVPDAIDHWSIYRAFTPPANRLGLALQIGDPAWWTLDPLLDAHEIARPKAPDEYRVIFLGDSATFCLYCPARESIPQAFTDLGVTINNIKAMSHLTLDYAYKIRGATHLKANDKEKARNALGTAYCWWMKYSNLMDSMYTGMKMQRTQDPPDCPNSDDSAANQACGRSGV